jgi:hypothetical protein
MRRLVRVVAGYVLSVVFATMVTAAAILPGRVVLDWRGTMTDPDIRILLCWIAGMVVAITLFPGIVLVWMAARLDVHGWWYYGLGGMMIPVLYFALVAATQATVPLPTAAIGACALAGFGSGLIYWAVAGRRHADGFDGRHP